MASDDLRRRHALTLAAAAAALAVVCAIVVAVGPADYHHSTYIWPPKTLTGATPSHGWFTPLPLLNRVPSKLKVFVPCSVAPAIRDERSAVVLGTARDPVAQDALRIQLESGALTLEVGGRRIVKQDWPSSCPWTVVIRDGTVFSAGRAIPLRLDTPGRMPVVTGLFTTLDLHSGEAPRIRLETRVYATSQTPAQIAATWVGVAAVAAALILVAGWANLRGVVPRVGGRLRAAWGGRDVTDAVVIGGLLSWWVLAPTFIDDGWVWAENRAFDDLGGLGLYYDTWGITSPTGYWNTWIEHWLVGATSDLIVMRIPSLLLLLAAWPLCRACVSAVLREPVERPARWALAGAFLIGATAWGMTLRPEPLVSLLLLVSLACMISFAQAPRPGPLALAAVASALGLTAHPAGILVAAPILAGLPEIWRWLGRGELRRWLELVVVALAWFALTLLLFVLDSDFSSRLEEARLGRAGDLHSEPLWHEYIRYQNFDYAGGATAVREFSLALIVLCAASLIRRPGSVSILSLPARSVAVGLALLTFVPSKWPWHFGTLAAIGAVTVGVETARLGRSRSRRPLRVLVSTILVLIAASIAWKAPGDAAPLDLQVERWRDSFTSISFLIVCVVGLAVFEAMRRVSSRRAVANTTALAVALLSVAIVALTMFVLATDAARTPWSPARQNLSALLMRRDCGLADELPDSAELVSRLRDPATATLLVPSVGLYFPCARIPRVRNGLIELPSLLATQGPAWPLEEHDGPFRAVADLQTVRTIARGPRHVQVAEIEPATDGFTELPAIEITERATRTPAPSSPPRRHR